MPLLAVDFESTASTNSTTRAMNKLFNKEYSFFYCQDALLLYFFPKKLAFLELTFCIIIHTSMLKLLSLFLFFIMFASSHVKAAAIKNWANGLIDVKNPKQHKNSFYISGGIVYNTSINTKIYQSGNLISTISGKEYGGKGFNIAIGYRYNFNNFFFISPEFSFISIKTGVAKNFMVSNVTYGSDVPGFEWHENFKYYDDICLKHLITISTRLGVIFKDRLLTYGRISLPTIITNDYMHFGGISDYGYGIGLGVGSEFNISTNFFIRLEYNYYMTFKGVKINNNQNLDSAPLKIKQNLGILNISLGLNFNVDDC